MYKKIISTNLPNGEKIELISYYDEFIDYYPNCEMQSKHWCISNIKKDWHIFDIGANIGYYTILFSKLAPEGVVYSFEPTDTIKMLEENIKYHKLKNVRVYSFAFSNRTGRFQDKIYKIWGKTSETKYYNFITIDDFVSIFNIERIDCIKIDVDSYDFEVLQGAENTLEKFNPYVLVELNYALALRNYSNMEALHWLAQKGYSEVIVLDYENFVLKKNKEKKKTDSHNIIIKFYEVKN